MSGFAGIVRLGGTRERFEADTLAVLYMAKAIAFRGPDGSHIWQHADIQTCFSLLKTGPAPQMKTQPCSLDGRCWLLGDIRLDGRHDLIRKFEQRGEKLDDDITDEELMLHVAQAYGEDAVAELDGDYSIAIWDSKKKELRAFRDLTGSKPFFYLLGDGCLSFSNALDALHRAPGFTAAYDQHYLADYLLDSWCPDPERTVYEKIRRLPPGHSLVFTQGGISVRQIAQFPMEDLLRYRKDEEYVENYRDILHRAVKDRLPDAPVVVFMSGGLDSTTVAATAAQIARRLGGSRRVRAQSVDYQPIFEDHEGEEARRVAEFLGIDFELLHVGDCQPYAGWDAPGFPMPEPRDEPFMEFHVRSYRRANQLTRVCFSGDGGDDVLLGQAWPYLRNLFKNGRVFTAVGGLIGHVWSTRKLPVLGLGIRSWIRNRFGEVRPKEAFPDWLASDFVSELNLRERFEQLWRQPVSDHPWHPWAYAMLSGPFWPNILEGEEVGCTGVAVETRAPLLDRRLIRYLLRLPAMPCCMDKQLVRRAMQGKLPDATIHRAKTPLADDPLACHIENRGWKPAMPEEFQNELRSLVDARRLLNCNTSTSDSNKGKLRLFSLNLWLKSVEMKRRIQ